jgi:hypothetical protein
MTGADHMRLSQSIGMSLVDPERTFVALLVISKTALQSRCDSRFPLAASHTPIQRVVWAALIAFAWIWREISQLIRLSFPFF